MEKANRHTQFASSYRTFLTYFPADKVYFHVLSQDGHTSIESSVGSSKEFTGLESWQCFIGRIPSGQRGGEQSKMPNFQKCKVLKRPLLFQGHRRCSDFTLVMRW